MQHLDEGRIHAWLDGQLPPDEAAAVEAHVAECRQCADAVAEARGLIAASSRILTALDSTPRDVAPKPIGVSESALPEGVLSLRREAPPNVEPAPAPVSVPAKRVPRRWFTAPTLAAAAAVVVAVGMFSLYQRDGVPTAASNISARAESASIDSSTAGTPAVAVAPPAAPQSLGAGAASANEARPQALPSPSRQGARREADRPVEAAKRFAAADSVLRDQELKVTDIDARADGAKPKDAVSRLQASAKPDTSTVTVIRGTAATAEPLAQRLLEKGTASANVGGISGRITDANNTGVANALVQVAGTNTAMTTNERGEYSLGGVQPGAQQLTVRRIGYQEAKREVSVVAGQTASADVVITPTTLQLDQVVVTGTSANVQRERAARSAPQPKTAAPSSAPTPVVASEQRAAAQPQSSAAGCYEWTVTSTTAQQRTRFLQVPRRLALDTVVTPSSNDGIWYRARDLSRTAVLPNGLWRPIDSGVEVQWVVGAKTSTVRLTGSLNAVMRGKIEEIDRAAGTGESGDVISMRRPCEG
jgi:anti-sigma factor RsiW